MKHKCVALIFIITQMYISVGLYGSNDYGDLDMDVSSVLKKMIKQESPQEANDYDYGNLEDLTLEISTDIKEIIPIEPLPVTISILNKTDKTIKAFSLAINPSYGLTQFYVSKENKPFEVFRAADWPAESIIRFEYSFKPGYRQSVDRYLFYAHPKNLDKEKRGQYLFEEPGHYRIKAIYTDSQIDKSIESNVISINVKEPKGEDASAYQFIKNMQDDVNKIVYYGNFLLWSDGETEIIEKQKEFIEKFPNSQYSRFLYYTLGKRNISKDSQKLKLSIDYLEKAANYEDFLFTEDSILKLIQIFTDTGQTDNARKYKEILAKRFPYSHEGKNYVEEVLGQVPPIVQTPPAPNKPIGIVLPIAGAAAAGIVIAGLLIFLRKKNPKTNKAE
jgi:hypothetical protein